MERLKEELSEVKKVIGNAEDEITAQKHKLVLKEGELKEQVEAKEKDIELVKLQAKKMEEQIFELIEEREQLLNEIRNLKYKLERSKNTPKEKETDKEQLEKFFKNKRKLKKEVTRLSVENEGLKEENEKLKEKLQAIRNKVTSKEMMELQNLNKRVKEIIKLMEAEGEGRTIKESAMKEQDISELASSILNTIASRKFKSSRKDVDCTKRIKLTLTKDRVLQ